MQRSILFALASAMALSLAPIAAAQPLSYNDLDLNSESGANAALSRIGHAAREECSFHEQSIIPIKQYTRIRACMTEFRNQAITETGSPLVRTRYEQRSATAWTWG
jgi:UrcA family protein